MPTLELSISSIQLLRRSPLPLREIKIIPIVSINGQEGISTEEGNRVTINNGFDVTLQFRSEFLDAVMTDRVLVRLLDGLTGSSLGHMYISLRRLIRQVPRENYFVVASESSSIAGFAKIKLVSQSVGIRATHLELLKAESVLQTKEYEESCPRLARMLQHGEPSLLPFLDIILSEGIESARNSDAEIAQIFSKDFETAAKPQNSITAFLAGAIDEITKGNPALKYENELHIEVKAIENLSLRPDGAQPSPKVVITAGSQESSTEVEQQTCNATFTRHQNNQFTIVGPNESSVQIVAYDDVGNGGVKLIGTAAMSCRSITLERNCVRPIPLLSEEGKYAGTVVLDFYTEDFGNNYKANVELQVKDQYSRVAAMLRHYDEPRIGETDQLVTGNLECFKELMEDLVEEYGLEPNSAVVEIKVLEMHSLLVRHSQEWVHLNEASQVIVEINSLASTEPLDHRVDQSLENPCPSLSYSVSSESKAVIVSVMEAKTRDLIGVTHVSLASLQLGTHKTRSHELIADAGTQDAKAVGVITIDLFSNQIGASHSMDESCELQYKNRIREAIRLLHPEELHLLDVILGTTYDIEQYCMSLEDTLDEQGLLLTKAASKPKVKVTALKSKNLPIAPNKSIQVRYQIRASMTHGPRGKGPNTSFLPSQCELDLEDPQTDELIVTIVTNAGEEISKLVIPVESLWLGESSKWYECWSHAYCVDACKEGQILIRLETINCGRESGDGSSLDLYKALEDEAADIHITEAGDSNQECLATSRFDNDGNPIEVTLENEEEVQGKSHTFIIQLKALTSLRADANVTNCVIARLQLRDQVAQTPSVVCGNLRCFDFRAQISLALSNPAQSDELTISIISAESTQPFGECVIDVTRINKNKQRDVTVPVIRNPCSDSCQVVGYINISLLCPTWGRKLRSAAVADVPFTSVARLTDFYRYYRKDRLHRIDFDLRPEIQFDKLMSELVKSYGPEPDTYSLQMTVVCCSDLEPPSAVVTGGYSVYVRLGKEQQQTETVASSDPIFNANFSFSASKKDDEGMEIIVLFMGKEYSRCHLSIKNLPPSAVKRRTVNLVANAGKKSAKLDGTITLEFFSENYGFNSLPSEEDEASLRDRVSLQLSKYAPKDLHRVEYMLGEFVGAEDALMTKLIADYNCLPGDARLALTVKEIRGLTRNGKSVERGNPFVKVKTHMEKVSTRTLSQVRDGYFDETFTFTMATPEKDYLQVSVFNSELGSDYLYGEALISIENLQRGTPRTITAMIVQRPGTKSASFGGYVTLVLRSDDFGSFNPVDINADSVWRQQLKNFFVRYCPERLHRIQAIPPNRAYMAKLIKEYGPPPNTDEVHVTVMEVRDAVGQKESATVLLQFGIDTMSTRNVHSHSNAIHFNETFTFGIADAETEDLTVIVQRQKDAKEYGRAMIGLRDLSKGKDLWVHLVANHSTEVAVIVGSIRLQIKTKEGKKIKQSQEDKSKQAQLRRRLECILTNSCPQDLHTLEANLSRYGNEWLRTLKEQYPRCEVVAPMTIRVRDLQTCLSGEFAIKVGLENGRPILKTNFVKIQASGNATFRDSIGTYATEDIAYQTLVFSLVALRGTTSSELSICRIQTKFCFPDFFNLRSLNFFNSSGQCIAKASAEIRSIAFKDHEANEISPHLWSETAKDIVTVVSKYEPSNLCNLDEIIRDSQNISTLHDVLKRQYIGEPSYVIYFNNCEVETVSQRPAKEQLELSIEGKPVVSNRKFSSDMSSVALEKDSKPALVPDLFNSSLAVFDQFSLSESSSPNRVRAHAQSPHGKSIRKAVSCIRLDLLEVKQASAILRLLSRSDGCDKIIAEAEISLLPYFGFIPQNSPQEVPLVSNGSIIALCRFDVSFPSSQIISPSLYECDLENLLKNKEAVFECYKQTYEYLRKNNPIHIKTLHVRFFEQVLTQGSSVCTEILDGYKSQTKHA